MTRARRLSTNELPPFADRATLRKVIWHVDASNVRALACAVVPTGRRCVQVSAVSMHSLALLDDGRIVTLGSDYAGNVSGAAASVPAGRRCVHVFAGGYCSLAMLDDGHLRVG